VLVTVERIATRGGVIEGACIRVQPIKERAANITGFREKLAYAAISMASESGSGASIELIPLRIASALCMLDACF
jgi:hypothetical protein